MYTILFLNLRTFFSRTRKLLNSNVFHFPEKALDKGKWKTEKCSRTPENGKQKIKKKNPNINKSVFKI